MFTSKDLNRKSFYTGMFFLLIILSCFQRLSLIDFGGFSLKVYHIYAVMCVIILLMKQKMVLPTGSIICFYLYILVQAIVVSGKWGINGLLFNYTFGIYILTLFLTLGDEFTLDDWMKIFRNVSLVILIAVIINIVMQYDKIIAFFNDSWGGHPSIETIFGGGVNLEATWVALFGFSFFKNKLKWAYIITSTLIAAILASRTGIIINVLCLIWIIFAEMDKNNIAKNFKRFFIIGVCVVIAFIIAMHYGALDIVLDRFKDTGNDRGSQGRENMWKYAYETIMKYPLGCGVGNNIKALETISGITYVESNMHNVYMQNVVDLGWLGGIWYATMVIIFIIKERKNMFHNPFIAMIYVYIITSMIQFRGGETILFLILGVYLCNRKYGEI